jgi:hypothetical protein
LYKSIEMDNKIILDELNENCFYRKKFVKGYIPYEWREEDINFVSNGHRNYCAKEFSKDSDYDGDGILCKSCACILEKYANQISSNAQTVNLQDINTDQMHETLKKILKRLDKIENDISEIKRLKR